MVWFSTCAYSSPLGTPNIVAYWTAVRDYFQQPCLCKEEAHKGHDLPSLCPRYCHIEILKICSLLQIVPVASTEPCALLPIYGSRSLEWLSCALFLMALVLAPVQNMQFPSSLVLQLHAVPPVTPACTQHLHWHCMGTRRRPSRGL